MGLGMKPFVQLSIAASHDKDMPREWKTVLNLLALLVKSTNTDAKGAARLRIAASNLRSPSGKKRNSGKWSETSGTKTYLTVGTKISNLHLILQNMSARQRICATCRSLARQQVAEI